MKRLSLTEKARELRSHIIDSIVRQEKKESMRELDSEDDDDDENDTESTSGSSENEGNTGKTAVIANNDQNNNNNNNNKNDKEKESTNGRAEGQQVDERRTRKRALKLNKANERKLKALTWVVGYSGGGANANEGANEKDGDDDNDNDDGDDKEKEKESGESVTTARQFLCVTCNLVRAVHNMMKEIESERQQEHKGEKEESCCCFFTSLSDIVDFLNLERNQVEQSNGTDTRPVSKSTSSSMSSSPRCLHHEKILWKSSSSSTLDDGEQRLFSTHLSKTVAGVWLSIWRKYLSMQRQKDGEQNGDGVELILPPPPHPVFGIRLGGYCKGDKKKGTVPLIEPASAENSAFVLFHAETKLLLQLYHFISSLLPPPSASSPSKTFQQQRISTFVKTKFVQPIFSFMESIELFRSSSSSSLSFSSSSCVVSHGEILDWCYFLATKLEEVLHQSEYYYYCFGNNCSSSSLPSASVTRVIEKTFIQEHLHGSVFSTALNSQYAKLVDANSKFWGSYVKTVVLAAAAAATCPVPSSSEIENDYILISHPIQWFVEKHFDSFSSFSSSSLSNFAARSSSSLSSRRRISFVTLLWLRSWLLVTPVNKFGMSQKFGDVIWFLAEIRRRLRSKGNINHGNNNNNNGNNTSRNDCDDHNEEFDRISLDIISIVLLHFLPIQKIDEAFDEWRKSKNENNQNQDKDDKTTTSFSVADFMNEFDVHYYYYFSQQQQHIRHDHNQQQHHHERIINAALSSSSVIQISAIFPFGKFTSRLVGSSWFWERVVEVVRIKFDEEEGGGEEDDDDEIDESSRSPHLPSSSRVIQLPSLSLLQNETGSAAIGFNSAKGFATFMENEHGNEEGKKKVDFSILQVMISTRFEFFDSTYPMPSEVEAKIAEQMLRKLR